MEPSFYLHIRSNSKWQQKYKFRLFENANIDISRMEASGSVLVCSLVFVGLLRSCTKFVCSFSDQFEQNSVVIEKNGEILKSNSHFNNFVSFEVLKLSPCSRSVLHLTPACTTALGVVYKRFLTRNKNSNTNSWKLETVQNPAKLVLELIR